MSDHQLPEDDDWLASMLEADRDVPSVAPGLEARMLARLGADLAAGAPSNTDGTDADGADATDGAEPGPDAGVPGPASAPAPAPATPLAGTAGVGAAAAAGGVTPLLAVACAVSLALGGVLGYAAHDVVSPPRVTDEPAAGAVLDTPPVAGAVTGADAGVALTVPGPADLRRDEQAPEDGTEAGSEDGTQDGDGVRASLGARRASADASTGSDVTPVTADDAAGVRDAGALAPTRDEALADENALITQAQSALARGRAGEALTALRDHQRRFPSGRFVEEREAMTVQALARTGQTEQARARAERFYTRYPNSLLTRAVRAAVPAP